MKMKAKPLTKIVVLLFGLSLFLWNCIREDFMNPQNTVTSNKLKYSLTKITYRELLADKEIKPSLPLIERRFSNQSLQSIHSRSTTEVAEGLTIFTDEINRIVTDDVITWTFRTQNPVLESSDFENFLVKKHNSVFTYFLISYEFTDLTDSETLYEKATSYVISEEYLSLEGLNLSSRDAFDWVFPNDGGGTGSGPCDGILVYDRCNLGGNADGHWPVLQNDGFTYCSGSPLLYIDFSHCENYGVPDSPVGGPLGGDDGSGGDQLIGGGGGGGNSGGDGDTTLTAPVEFADPRCPTGSGKVMIDGVCVCPPHTNKVEGAGGNCVCPEGKIETYQGVCVDKPCEGNPVPNPEIAPQYGPSGTQGAMFGNASSGGCKRYGGNHCTTLRNKKHDGLDIKNAIGNPVHVMYDGFIYSTGYSDDLGYYITIQSTVNGNTILITYAHMQKDNRITHTPGTPLVYVKAGDIMGYQGDTGNIKGAIASKKVDPHVHIEVKQHNGSSNWGPSNYNFVDPRSYFSTVIDNQGISQPNTNCN
ncbi:MAG: peptidoglycan DD-metalloendopeptidase family protein [Flavobacteriaceae bacterium]|nr:MAG: peptidoglycan DD-metalloendopeptidase family protein [Flavobacteriaceae bacterium]